MVGDDIAFEKNATASSILGEEKGRSALGPQFVTNGLSACATESGPIAHTINEANPWFKIHLQGTFYIKTVVVNPREGKFYDI